MKVKTSEKAGGNAAARLERQQRAITLLRDSGQTLKIKSGLKAGLISKYKGQ